jgi:hypothetical protein
VSGDPVFTLTVWLVPTTCQGVICDRDQSKPLQEQEQEQEQEQGDFLQTFFEGFPEGYVEG